MEAPLIVSPQRDVAGLDRKPAAVIDRIDGLFPIEGERQRPLSEEIHKDLAFMLILLGCRAVLRATEPPADKAIAFLHFISECGEPAFGQLPFAGRSGARAGTIFAHGFHELVVSGHECKPMAGIFFTEGPSIN